VKATVPDIAVNNITVLEIVVAYLMESTNGSEKAKIPRNNIGTINTPPPSPVIAAKIPTANPIGIKIKKTERGSIIYTPNKLQKH